jgi:hypothetical protein
MFMALLLLPGAAPFIGYTYPLMVARQAICVRPFAALAVPAFAIAAACTTAQPRSTTYFDGTIAPILTAACARSPTGAGCHTADAKGNAFGNLDLSTYDGVSKRRDLLVSYGAYQQPALLLKATPPTQVDLTAYDGKVEHLTLDIRHAGGPILDPRASAFLTLRRWIDEGATANNAGAPPPTPDTSPCRPDVPAAPGFDAATDPAAPDYAAFVAGASAVLVARCASGNCHGFRGNPLHLTCGDTPEQKRWNYFAASGYVGSSPAASELVRRPLGSAVGASFHEGGVVFASSDDPGYQALVAWAGEHGPPAPAASAATPGFDYFAHRVEPALVRKGCMMMQCHSASSFNDLQLSGGFSLASTQRNYALVRAQMAFESEDPNASRLVRKNLYRPDLAKGGLGIVHRGGALFEDFGAQLASGAACDGHQPAYDYDGQSLDEIPAYCVVREWLRRERSAMNLAPLSAIVYVRRPPPPAPDRMQDFDVYAPGAELHVVAATLGADGTITLGADTVVNAGCGLDPASADIRRPAVSWDGTRVAFAARTSAGAPLAIYEMAPDGTGCALNADIAAHAPSAGGLLVHDFDPAYSPPEPDGSVHLAFASTRGGEPSPSLDYSGPQRSPADPSKPNADLFVYERDPASPGAMRIRRLTYLLNMERAPAFMSDGRVVLTAEKREPGFYQLALRRQNIDGGDYHPLYSQRPSLGYGESTQVVQIADKNFAFIGADPGTAHHGGALCVFNRSIGVDFTSGAPTDYPMDPGVIDPSSPSSPDPRFFLHSLHLPDPGASGVYSSPAPLPDDRILVSFGAAASGSTFDGDYDVYVVDSASGVRTRLLGQPGTAEVEAVAVYARTPRGVYKSAWNDPNAYGIDATTAAADVVDHDALTVDSLMFQNTPTGRKRESLASFEVWEELPPAPGVTSMPTGGDDVASDAYGSVYVRRRLVGTVPVLSDGSTHWRAPGGVPLLVHLPDTDESRAGGFPRWQREQIMFAPGELRHEALPYPSFDSFCAGCHGSISGRPVDAALRPDVFTHASESAAIHAPPTDLSFPAANRGTVIGAPRSP